MTALLTVTGPDVDEDAYWAHVTTLASELADHYDEHQALDHLASGDTGLTPGGSMCWSSEEGRRVWDQDDHDLVTSLADAGLVNGLQVTNLGRDVLAAVHEQAAA